MASAPVTPDLTTPQHRRLTPVLSLPLQMPAPSPSRRVFRAWIFAQGKTSATSGGAIALPSHVSRTLCGNHLQNNTLRLHTGRDSGREACHGSLAVRIRTPDSAEAENG